VASKERTKVETGMKELTFLSWAKSGPLLAVGTAKGNLLLYNEKLGKRVRDNLEISV
jgi:WD repeat-containing protein 19